MAAAIARAAGWLAPDCPDLAGLGSTDDHDGDRAALDDYAHDVVALLDRLEIDRAHVAGLSLGGYVALAVARLAPERVDGLVLADTKAPADNAEQRAARDRLIATLEAGGPDAVADRDAPAARRPDDRARAARAAGRVRAQIGLNRAPGLRRAILRLRDRPDARPGLAAVAVPTLVIVGDEDIPTPTSRRRVPGAADSRARASRSLLAPVIFPTSSARRRSPPR